MKTFAEILADHLEENGKVRDMGRPPVEDTERMAAKELRAMQSRIEALENEMQEQARIIGMDAERELALIAKVGLLEKENASLKQDAVRWSDLSYALNRGISAAGHGRRFKIVEICPMYGDEKEVSAIDVISAMQKD